MAYQSPENAQKLRDMPRVATNNADPARLLMDGNPSAQPNSSQQDFASPSIMQRLGAAGTSNQSDDPLRMMQRLGAAVRGESFEFNNKLDAKDKQLSQDRKQAALADLSQVGDMLNKGYVDEARQLLVDRVGKIEQLGGNSTGTTRLLDIVDKGNTGLATTIVNQELEKAYMIGLLERPPANKGEAVQSASVVGSGSNTATIITMKNGEQRVINASGQELSGDERSKALAMAAGSTVSQRASIAKGEANASKSVAQSQAMFEKLGDIAVNISNYTEAIRLVEVDGADTGPIMRLLPDINANAVKLSNVRKRLGLDVVGSVTFGALSESELDLALSTGMPDNLKPRALVQWLKDKKAAQQKLSDNMTEAAIYLGRDGNTISSFLSSKKAEKDEKNKPKWSFRTPQKGGD